MFVLVSVLYFFAMTFMASFVIAAEVSGIGVDLSVVTLQVIAFGILVFLWKKTFDYKSVKQKVIDQSDLAITQRKTYMPIQFWVSLLFIYLANDFTMVIQNTALYYIITFVTFGICFMLMYPLLIESIIGLRKNGILKIIIWPVLMAMAILAFNLTYSVVLDLLGVVAPSDSVNELAVNAMILQDPIRMFLMVTFNAAIMEEIIFRGLGFRTLLHRNKWAAYVLTFVVFSLPHLVSGFSSGRGLIELVFMPLYGMMGVFMAISYHKTESMFASMLTHFLNNSLAFFSTFAVITFLF